MNDAFKLQGVFSTRRYEDGAVLRALDMGDPIEIELLRQEAFDKALREGLPLSFEEVERTEKEQTISLTWYDLVFDTMLKGEGYTPNVRIGLFGDDVTPTEGLTITSFRAALAEATGFTVNSSNSTNRSTTTFAVSSGQSITNSAVPSRFTFTGTDTIYGAFLTQGATLKDGTNDSSPAVYLAGGKFSASQPVSNGSIIDIVYTQSK